MHVLCARGCASVSRRGRFVLTKRSVSVLAGAATGKQTFVVKESFGCTPNNNTVTPHRNLCTTQKFVAKDPSHNATHTEAKRVFDSKLDGLDLHKVHKHLTEPNEQVFRDETISLGRLDALQNVLVDLDVDKLCKSIEDAAKNSPSQGQKLFAVVRGHGGGKSRALEEMRCKLTGKQDTVVLAITSSHAIEFANTKHLFKDWSTKLHFAAQMVLRFSFALYGATNSVKVAAVEAITEATNVIHSTHRDTDAATAANQLIRGFLAHATERVAVSKGLTADSDATVVVLVDEAMLFHEYYKKRKENDIFQVLQDAMLSSEKHIASNIHTALVISSPEVRPVMRPISGCTLVNLELPVMLSKENVVNKWWLPEDNNQIVDRELKAKQLILLAAVLNGIPRGMSIAAMEIEKRWGNPCDRQGFSTVWNNVVTRLQKSYPRLRGSNLVLFEPHIAHAVVFGLPVPVKDLAIPELIADSSLINQVHNSSEKGELVPKASLAMIFQAEQLCAGVRLDDMSRVVKALKQQPQKETAGLVLQRITGHWLTVRLQVLTANKHSAVSLGKLFGCKTELQLLDTVVQCNEAAIFQQGQFPLSFKQSESEDEALKFFTLLTEALPATTNNTEPRIWTTHASERFDLVLTATDKHNQPHAVIVDLKASWQQTTESQPATPKNALPNDQLVAHVEKLSEQARAHVANNEPVSPFAKALAAKRYTVVFFSTNEGEDFEILPQHVVCVRASTARSFLGPLWELHQTLQTTCSSHSLA